jgi:hypothetical protein
MGSTGYPKRWAQPGALQAGGVLAYTRRGAQGRSGHAAEPDVCPARPAASPRARCPGPAISQDQPRNPGS